MPNKRFEADAPYSGAPLKRGVRTPGLCVSVALPSVIATRS